jgi:hypothetical protein
MTAIQTTTGVIEKLNQKSIDTKRGPASLYSVSVGGQWYNNGFKAVDFSEQDTVTISYIENDYGKQVKDIALAQGATPSPAPAPIKTYGATPKDVMIVRQNACTQANAMFSTLIAAGKEPEITAQTIIAAAKEFESFCLGLDEVE